jgi:hypothetical protein
MKKENLIKAVQLAASLGLPEKFYGNTELKTRVSSCSCYSLEQHEGGVILMSLEGNEIILNAEDTRNLGNYLIEITNQG